MACQTPRHAGRQPGIGSIGLRNIQDRCRLCKPISECRCILDGKASVRSDAVKMGLTRSSLRLIHPLLQTSHTSWQTNADKGLEGRVDNTSPVVELTRIGLTRSARTL